VNYGAAEALSGVVREGCRIAYVILACVVLLTIISVGRLVVPLLF
jgi:hypothetical protein